MTIRTLIAAALASASVLWWGSAAAATAISDAELKSRVEAAVKDLQDLTMMGTVVYKDSKVLARMEESFARLYEFKSAAVMFKSPDKLRLEGKLGMVKFEYIINGGLKIFRAPAVKMNRAKDYSHDPAKLQEPLDIGLITPLLWRGRQVEVLEDPESEANGEIKLSLRWMKGSIRYLAWIDADRLWLKRFEKRNGDGELTAAAVYSNPIHAGEVVWMPTRVDLYAGDGQKAAASEFTEIKVNTGLDDSLFK